MITQYTKSLLAIMLLVLLSNFALAYNVNDGPHIPNDIGVDNCSTTPDAYDRDFDHVMILIDKTSWLEKEQKNWIKNTLFNENFFQSYRPYTKFSLMFIDNKSVENQKLIYQKCRIKSGIKSKKWPTEIISKSENAAIVGAWYKDALDEWVGQIDKIGTTVESDNSFIFETIIRTIRDVDLGFDSANNPKREIIIFSDLMQHSNEFSFYRICNATSNIRNMNKCPSFQSVLDKNEEIRDYIKYTDPRDTENLTIKLKFMNFKHQSNEEINTSLINLWGDYFRKIGIEIPSNQLDWVERQLNFSGADE